MKAHELARRLLAGLNEDVQIPSCCGNCFVHEIEIGDDYEVKETIWLTALSEEEEKKAAEDRKRWLAEAEQREAERERQMQERWGPLLP